MSVISSKSGPGARGSEINDFDWTFNLKLMVSERLSKNSKVFDLAMGNQHIEKAWVFFGFWSFEKQQYWKTIGAQWFLTLWEAHVLNKHWCSLFFEALGSKSIAKALVFITFWTFGKQHYWKSVGFHYLSSFRRWPLRSWKSVLGAPGSKIIAIERFQDWVPCKMKQRQCVRRDSAELCEMIAVLL